MGLLSGITDYFAYPIIVEIREKRAGAVVNITDKAKQMGVEGVNTYVLRKNKIQLGDIDNTYLEVRKTFFGSKMQLNLYCPQKGQYFPMKPNYGDSPDLEVIPFDVRFWSWQRQKTAFDRWRKSNIGEILFRFSPIISAVAIAIVLVITMQQMGPASEPFAQAGRTMLEASNAFSAAVTPAAELAATSVPPG